MLCGSPYSLGNMFYTVWYPQKRDKVNHVEIYSERRCPSIQSSGLSYMSEDHEMSFLFESVY